MALVMGIDLGTSSTKTVLMDEAGQVVATASAGYPLLTPRAGWVEQNPSDWWRAVCDTIRQAIRQLTLPLTARDIKGVSLSGQMNGAVCVDSAGNPTRPALSWLDGRSQRECDDANERAGDLLRERALHVLNPINTLAKVLWLRENEPDCYADAYHILIPKDWIRFRLTGGFASDVSDASVTAALDLYTRDWSDEILDTLKVRRDLFPPVVESPTIVGKITEAAAAETGLVAGTAVCAGGGDMACMAVGGGVIKPGIVNVGIGTAGHVLTFAENISDEAFNQLWPMCHAVPGKYFWLGCSYTGGASLAWFRDQFGGGFEDLTAQAANVPTGSEGLFFMPWFQGTATPHPDARARGGWIGLTLHHTKAHLVRALMEGVAFDLRHSLECFKRLGLPIDEIRIGEGGAKSVLWRHIQADVFGRDVRVMETRDASAIGAAMIAGVGVGLFEGFASRSLIGRIGLGETVPCSADRAEQYERCYRQYSRLYPTLKAWFHGA
jgi:xylulokinase